MHFQEIPAKRLAVGDLFVKYHAREDAEAQEEQHDQGRRRGNQIASKADALFAVVARKNGEWRH